MRNHNILLIIVLLIVSILALPLAVAAEADATTTSAGSRLIYLIIGVVLVGIISWAVYLIYRKPSADKLKVGQDIKDYITSQVKKGRKFPEIKQQLLHAGWNLEHVHEAYKETLKHNYKRYLSAQNNNDQQAQRNKIIAIAGISIVLVIGIIVLINGSVGQAINFQKSSIMVGDESGNTNSEDIALVSCTPPHIFNLEKTGCCLDYNSNDKCDYLENQNVENPTLPVTPSSDLQCSRVCTVYSLMISTSDGVQQVIRPNHGSYTAGGAIDWDVKPTPNFCEGAEELAYIQITKKKFATILGTEMITLHEGETSAIITHPELPNIVFTLRADKIGTVCADSEAELSALIDKLGGLKAPVQPK